ncbi:hypothetical protein ACYSNO_06645 [Enterococcus sp. LJL98]
MNKLTIENLILTDNTNEINLEFLTGDIYIISSTHSNDSNLNEIFNLIGYFKTTSTGKIYLNEIDIRQFDPLIYRKNMITIADEKNSFIQNLKVMEYLKLVTDNFYNVILYDDSSIDNYTLVNTLLEDFKFNNTVLKKSIKNLKEIEKWNLKIVESLLKGSKFLIIYKTLDYFNDEIRFQAIQTLNKLLEKYNLGILIFSSKNYFENQIKKVIYI